MPTVLILSAVILIITVLILTVLYSEARFYISYDTSLRVEARILLFKIHLFPSKKKRKKKNGEKTEKKGGVAFSKAEAVFRIVLTLVRKARILSLFLRVQTGCDDAAQTAITHGTICAIVYPAARLLCPQNSDIDISASFDVQESKVIFSTELRIKPIYIIDTIINSQRSSV